MKHLLVSAALLGLASASLGSPAFASTNQNYAEADAAEVPGMPAGIDPARIQMSPSSSAPHPLVRETDGDAIVLSSGGLSAHYLIGVKVTDEQGDPIGTIKDLVFSNGGKTEGAVLSVGGFMGYDTKEVAVPFHEFSISGESQQHPTARIGLTLTALKKLPAFNADRLASDDVLVSTVLGAQVKPMDVGGTAVTLTDLIIDPDGASQYAAVEYGGIDGIGAKRTIVEFTTLGQLKANSAIPLNLKMAVLKKAQPFIYKVNGSISSIPEMFNG